MKVAIVTLLILITLMLIGQAFTYTNSNNTETYPYEVLKEFPDFEIRRYESRAFSYYTMPRSTYKESSGEGFRTLAGYIFGKNETGEKIAMTSPVAMNMGDSVTMMFMIPSSHNMDDLPKPENPSIQFKKEPVKTVAAITFGGWASDEKINEYKEKLKNRLDMADIAYTGEFTYLGYNPPFEVINRRNEIIVEINYQ